ERADERAVAFAPLRGADRVADVTAGVLRDVGDRVANVDGADVVRAVDEPEDRHRYPRGHPAVGKVLASRPGSAASQVSVEVRSRELSLEADGLLVGGELIQRLDEAVAVAGGRCGEFGHRTMVLRQADRRDVPVIRVRRLAPAGATHKRRRRFTRYRCVTMNRATEAQ